MPTQQNQPPTAMQPNDAAAALAMATHISTQLSAGSAQGGAQGGTDNSQMPQDAAQATPAASPTTDLTPRLEALEGQFIALKGEVQKAIKDEMETVREMIKEALASDNQHGQD